jgi:hypothetical protein
VAFQTIIVLDNPPNDSDPWAASVFRQAKCTVVNNEAVARAMAEDPKTAEALAKGDPAKRPEEFAGFYRKALEKLHAKDARLGLYGTAWLQYLRAIDACVVDWSALEAVSKMAKPPHTPEQVRVSSQNFVRARMQKAVAKDRILELSRGLGLEQKVGQTISFLAGFNLL